MEKRHEDQFLARLDRVMTHGVVEIHREEIKLWFGQDRISRRTWRQMADYWKEIVDNDAVQKLAVAGTDSDIWIFAWFEGNGTGEGSYFQDVRYHAGRVQQNGEPFDGAGQAEVDSEPEEPASRKTVMAKDLLNKRN